MSDQPQRAQASTTDLWHQLDRLARKLNMLAWLLLAIAAPIWFGLLCLLGCIVLAMLGCIGAAAVNIPRP